MGGGGWGGGGAREESNTPSLPEVHLEVERTLTQDRGDPPNRSLIENELRREP